MIKFFALVEKQTKQTKNKQKQTNKQNLLFMNSIYASEVMFDVTILFLNFIDIENIKNIICMGLIDYSRDPP